MVKKWINADLIKLLGGPERSRQYSWTLKWSWKFLIVQLENAACLLSVSCLWLLVDQCKEIRENPVAPHMQSSNEENCCTCTVAYFFAFFGLFWPFLEEFAGFFQKNKS